MKINTEAMLYSGGYVNKTKLSDIFKGGALVLLGSVISLGFTFLTRLVVARGLQPSSYGSYVLATTIISLASTFCLFGLDTGVGRYLPRISKKNKQTRYLVAALIFSLILSVISAFILYLTPNIVYENIFGESISKNLFSIFVISLPFIVIYKVTIGYSQGNQTAKPRVLLKDILLPSLKLLTLYLAVEFSLGLSGVSYSYVLSHIVISILCMIYISDNIGTSTDISQIFPKRGDFTEILGFSAPLLISSIMTFIFRDADSLLLGVLATGRDIGVYDVNYRAAMISLVLLNSLAFLFLPAISELDSEDKINKIRELFNSVNKWIIIGSSPVILVFLLYPSYTISMIFGSEYRSPLTLRILIIGMYIHIFFGPIGNALTSIGLSKLLMYDNIAASLLNILLNVILIPIYGLVGAAIATTLSFIFLNLVYAIQFEKEIGISIVNMAKIKPLSIVGTSTIITLPIKYYLDTSYISIIITFIIFIISIIVLSYVFVITTNELDIIKSELGLE